MTVPRSPAGSHKSGRGRSRAHWSRRCPRSPIIRCRWSARAALTPVCMRPNKSRTSIPGNSVRSGPGPSVSTATCRVMSTSAGCDRRHPASTRDSRHAPAATDSGSSTRRCALPCCVSAHGGCGGPWMLRPCSKLRPACLVSTTSRHFVPPSVRPRPRCARCPRSRWRGKGLCCGSISRRTRFCIIWCGTSSARSSSLAAGTPM